MNIEYLNTLVSEEAWRQCHKRLNNKEVIEVLRELFNYIVNTLTLRIDDIKVDDGKAISFFTSDREFLTINVTRNDLRIYIHPAARALFEPDAKFQVEKFNFWKSSYQKTSGKYRAMSIWISDKKYLQEVKDTIDLILEALEV